MDHISVHNEDGTTISDMPKFKLLLEQLLIEIDIESGSRIQLRELFIARPTPFLWGKGLVNS